ncbi:hypothetical protein HK413_05620 [Mucilaginibacter sp. S1162]|uniref:Uncharacterized protein n=1 Tax=Mucilaginibacter humi TaxID=2732510 RepID=A0ABX1W1L7_9SPHI|nr:hypothetical protein [Mucilaginibacter humi]NNU33749.1 hypothetical protein [Mucilaginibacter humi]
MGINIHSKTINDDYLTHLWTVSSTVKQYYDSNDIVVSGVSVPNRFTSVLLDDNAKTFTYTNAKLLYSDQNASGPYRLSLGNNVLYIELASNVFFENATSTTRISNLTAYAMTWLTIDNNTVIINGKPVHEAYQVIFASSLLICYLGVSFFG